MTSKQFDEHCMHICLRLARKAGGRTNPNPMVGAVIARARTIIARGYHRRVGSAHAEMEALRRAGALAKGATLYVNLEPCSHFGRTPPCADTVIRSGVVRVVCSHRDPNPNVSGQGIAKLKQAGIAVSVGLNEKEARELNEAFITFHERRRPFVALKFAASLDGKLGARTGGSQWITGKDARAFARSLRENYQAVLVGAETVLHDDPHLGARKRGCQDPLRIILDPRLRVPLSARVFRDANALVASTTAAPRKKRLTLEKRGISVITFARSPIPLRALLEALRRKEIISILVEGGGETLGHFVDAGCIDKVYAFFAPVLIGGKDAISIGGKGVSVIAKALRLPSVSLKRFGKDILIIGARVV